MHRRAHYFRYYEEDNPLYIPKTSVINECPFKEPTYATILLDNLTYVMRNTYSSYYCISSAKHQRGSACIIVQETLG